MERDKWDALFEDDGEDIAALMGDETIAEVMRFEGRTSNVEWADGFLAVHEVRASEPWRESLVRRDERPRVALSIITRKCDQCGEQYKARRTSSRYCGATCRKAADRAR